METHTLKPISLPPISQRHFASIGFVVLIHAALIYALLNLGVIDYVLPKAEPPLVVVEVPPETTHARLPIPQPADPAIRETTIPPVSEPVITYDTETAIGPLVNVPPGNPRLTTGPRSIESTHTIPVYPAIERRLGREGIVSVRVNISDAGFVTGVALTRSSGFKGLDDAAVSWIKKHWRYKPAIRNGVAVPSTAIAQVKFELH